MITDGFFYVVQLLPDALPERLKLGFSNSPKKRLLMHRTAAPTAILLKCWPCLRAEEHFVRHAITDRQDCTYVAGEVYDVADIGGFLTDADRHFAAWHERGYFSPPPEPKCDARPQNPPPTVPIRIATDCLFRRVTIDEIAHELGVSANAVARARLDPDSPHYRPPPRGWEDALRKVALRRFAELDAMANTL